MAYFYLKLLGLKDMLCLSLHRKRTCSVGSMGSGVFIFINVKSYSVKYPAIYIDSVRFYALFLPKAFMAIVTFQVVLDSKVLMYLCL